MANKLNISKSGITVLCERGDTDTYKLLQDFYPIHSNRTGTQHSLSIRNIPEVLEKLRGITSENIDTAPLSVQNFWYNELNARSQMNNLLTEGPIDSPVVNKHLTLKPHQELGREIARIRHKYCFFFDTRTGKTPLSLSIIWDDVMKHPTHKWLVVCPLILIENAWLEDAASFVPELTIVNCHASTKAKRLKAMQRQGSIYVTNTESFAAYKEHFDGMGFYGCFVDESSSMKSHKSQQSKALVDFAQTMSRFYLLSGTPAPNGEWEYYMQLKAVDYYSVPASYTRFKERYFVNISYNPQFEDLLLRPDKKEELTELISKYALYVDKEDVLTTPGRTFVEVPMDLPLDLCKQYNLMKRELYMEIGDKPIIVDTAAAKFNKLRQISSGFIIDTKAVKENAFYEDSNEQEWYLLDDYRFKYLKDLLQSENCAGQQVLIWANYRKEFEIISTMLGDRCRCVYGGVSLQDKTDAIRQFKDGRIQYLVANPASADKGLTLTNCHICIYFSLNWSYELFKQSMERIYGDISKQPEHCLYYVMLANKTIDTIIYNEVLQGKASSSMSLLNHLKGPDL